MNKKRLIQLIRYELSEKRQMEINLDKANINTLIDFENNTGMATSSYYCENEILN